MLQDSCLCGALDQIIPLQPLPYFTLASRIICFSTTSQLPFESAELLVHLLRAQRKKHLFERRITVQRARCNSRCCRSCELVYHRSVRDFHTAYFGSIATPQRCAGPLTEASWPENAMINALQAILPGGRPVISNKQNTMHCPANCPFSSSTLSQYIHQFFPVEAKEPLPRNVTIT